jgi:hypothetical protein
MEYGWPFVYALSIFAAFRVRKFPKIPLAYLAPLIFFAFWKMDPIWQPALIDRLCFGLLVLLGFNTGFNGLLISALSLGFMLSTADIGNTNMNAQTAAIGAAFFWPLGIPALIYAWWEGCRSAMIGLSALISIKVFSSMGIKVFRRYALIPIVPVAVYIVMTKAGLSGRETLWQAAGAMILERPMGWGVDQFEFASRPYGFISETVLAKSPHNEFLRFAVEDGIPFAMLILYLGRFLSIGYLAVFGAEFLFQFPLLLPLPFAVTALAIGDGMRRVYAHSDVNMQWLAIPVLIGAVIFTVARHGGNDERSCRLMPTNWKACVNTRDPKLLRRELEIHPNNFVAKRVLESVLPVDRDDK